MSSDIKKTTISSRVNVEDGSKLCLDVRLIIWRELYYLQSPRIVEVRTQEHSDCSNHESWCPRYSPSPSPTVVNVCHEAREEAQNVAQKAGHLLFTTGPDSPAIYFNPEIDTLYVPNEKEYWIRDWDRCGILTQVRKERPMDINVLAIGLDPVERGTTALSLEQDFNELKMLKDIIFVVKSPDGEIFGCIRQLNGRLRVLQRENDERVQRGAVHQARAFPSECKIAILRGGRFIFVENPTPLRRRTEREEIRAIRPHA
jgi:hypothetical protein